MRPNILVCGKTGVGKTSLIQAVTHRDVVPDSAIGNGKPIAVGFQAYETEVANFIDCEGMNPETLQEKSAQGIFCCSLHNGVEKGY